MCVCVCGYGWSIHLVDTAQLVISQQHTHTHHPIQRNVQEYQEIMQPGAGGSWRGAKRRSRDKAVNKIAHATLARCRLIVDPDAGTNDEAHRTTEQHTVI